MPPNVKFTRDEIIEAALELARTEGMNAITARALGKKLGTSSRPIFTAFQNMDEVEREVIIAAKKHYNQYVYKGLSQESAFKGVGMQYIRFAKEEPKLFQLLFMSEQASVPDIATLLNLIDDHYKDILLSVQKLYYLDEAAALKLYRHLWVYTHGIATLCATKVCDFSEKEIDGMLTDVFAGIIMKVKQVKQND